MTEIVYSSTRVRDLGGRTYRNPAFFVGVEPANRVFVIGKYPHVVEAYRKAGVPVVTDAAPRPLSELPAPPAASLVIDDRGGSRPGDADEEAPTDDPDAVLAMSDDDLRAAVERLTGRVPNWNARRETLERRYREARVDG